MARGAHPTELNYKTHKKFSVYTVRAGLALNNCHKAVTVCAAFSRDFVDGERG
jgi:hypothetical protein